MFRLRLIASLDLGSDVASRFRKKARVSQCGPFLLRNVLGNARGDAQMAKDRGPLGKLADRIRKESPLPVFAQQSGFDVEDNPIYWEGDDPAPFLEFAKRVGAKAIYVQESVIDVDNTDEKLAGHLGETSFLDVAFLLDGRVHIFAQGAPWLEGGGGGEEPGEGDVEPSEEGEDDIVPRRIVPPVISRRSEKRVEELLRSRREEAVGTFLKGLEALEEPIDPSFASVDRTFRDYLLRRLRPEDPYLYLLPHDGSPLDALIGEVVRPISEDLVAKERVRVEALVPECVAWARNLSIRSLSKSDVEVFLDEKRERLSSSGQRLLWTKAKLAVKTGK